MPLGYKYAERDTDSYVDWSTVGKNLSDALAKEAEDRRTKIKEFEDQNLADIDYLNRAPQGAFTSATDFTNNFAHDAKQQSLINYRLLRAGKMDPRQYTLNRQNMMNGTNLIFDLQKTYQKEFDDTMAGVQSGDLQSLNIANMSMVEKYGDFTKSKAVINPLDGTVNIGMMQLNPKTGVMELSKDVMPVSLAMNKISTKIKTFKVDEAIDNSIKSFGDRKDAIYSAATITGAGTITELLGVEALAKYPGIKNFKETVDKFNEAVNTTIAGYFSGNKYNLSSVLTENTGKYNADSYTYDKDLAAKDKTKLLLKVDPNTKLNVLDESAPHFAEQKKEAEDWVRTQIMSRLDSERKISTTSQSQQLRAKPEKTGDEKSKESKAVNFGKMLAFLTTGNAAQKQQAADYFKSIEGITGLNSTATGIDVTKKDGSSLPFSFTNADIKASPDEMGSSLVKALNLEGFDEDIILTSMRANIPKGAQINENITASGKVIPKKEPDPVRAFNTYVAQIPDKIDETSMQDPNDQTEQADFIRRSVGEVPDVTVKGTGTFGDYVTVYYKEGKTGEKKIEVSTNATGRKTAMGNIKTFLKGLTPIEKKAAGMVESDGLGSKY